MPDWSYQTVFQPLLFKLMPETGRAISIGAIGRLGAFPAGVHVIDFMGHMNPETELAEEVAGLRLSSPIGLGSEIDPKLNATRAFTRFGFGFIEVGPVSLRPRPSTGRIVRHNFEQSWSTTDESYAIGPEEFNRRLAGVTDRRVQIILRIAPETLDSPTRAAEECRWVMERVVDHAAGFLIHKPNEAWTDEEFKTFLGGLFPRVPSLSKSFWFSVRPDLPEDEIVTQAASAVEAGFGLIRVEGYIQLADNERLYGLPVRDRTLATVKALRKTLGPDFPIAASGGIHEPIDALRLRDAGAQLVVIDTGFVFTGPGLPKRVNEVLAYQNRYQKERLHPSVSSPRSIFQETWFWLLLMGLGMFIGSLMALAIAMTRVVLPYDEAFVGMSRDQLHAINPRLLSFMAHDRVSLAGTMITIGGLYSGLAFFGIRRGMHWAWKSLVLSGSVGFLSFFLFLGFSYFDPFHAFVTLVLFQFLIAGLTSNQVEPQMERPPALRNDSAWRWSLWAQFLFVFQACGFVVAGLIISGIGCTFVFVPEDLHFMETTAEAIATANPRLVPLIAHDRATFGGMLVASGLVFLTTTLWGFRAGRKWLWWSFLLAGLPGYTAAIAVHLIVGYDNLFHLSPAFGGLSILGIGLWAAYPFLIGNIPDQASDWQSYLQTRSSP